MALSKSWGYAVRALVRMAHTDKETTYRWQAGELAEQAGLPSSFLSKVLSALTGAGLIESSRGRGGGVRLARSADKIRLIDVARALGEQLPNEDELPGFEDAHECLYEEIHRRWQPYQRANKEFLQETTILDLARTLND